MQILFYLLEFNLYLVMLYSLYRLLLHRETFHQLNRWYLLMAVVLSFAAPLFKVNYQPAVLQELKGEHNVQVMAGSSELVKSENNKTNKQSSTLLRLSPAIKANTNVTAPTVFINPVRMLLTGYLALTLFCLINIFTGLLRIIKLYRRSPKFHFDGVTHVLLEQEQEAFSFFKWLFYYPATQPESAIIAHELVHIRQKHSLDLLFLELVRAINWFNPVIYLMRQDLKLNHEYLADEQASLQSINSHAYALLLIDHSCSKIELAMTHQMFSARQLKSRILRLGKKRSDGKAKLKYMLALPVLAVIIGLSAFTISKDYGLVSLTIINNNTLPSPARLTSVPALGIKLLSDKSFGAVNDDQKPASPSANLPADREIDIARGAILNSNDTVPLKAVTPSTADSLRNKYWAPQDIRDSVQKYEWAAKLISDSIQYDGRMAFEILNSIQKERSDRYRKILDSSQKAMAAMPVKDRLYNTPADDVPDQITKDRLAQVNAIISRINTNYAKMQRLIELSNAQRSQVRDDFPMVVAKTVAKLIDVVSLDGIKIPVPQILYKDAWVKNETERVAFFAVYD